MPRARYFIHCPQCGVRINYTEDSIDTVRRCPGCGRKLVLPPPDQGFGAWPYLIGCGFLLALGCCGLCGLGSFFPGRQAAAPQARAPEAPAPDRPPPPPKEDKERVQGEWVDAAGEWVWAFAGDEVTIWRRGSAEADVRQVVLWPAPANQIDLWGDSRRGIYRFDGDKRLTLALGPDAAHRPRTFDPADGVELVALRPLSEAEAEWSDHAPAEAAPSPDPSPAPAADPPPAGASPAGGGAGRFSPVPPAGHGPKTVHVHEYTRKDGTVVHAHDRAAPGHGGGRRR